MKYRIVELSNGLLLVQPLDGIGSTVYWTYDLAAATREAARR